MNNNFNRSNPKTEEAKLLHVEDGVLYMNSINYSLQNISAIDTMKVPKFEDGTARFLFFTFLIVSGTFCFNIFSEEFSVAISFFFISVVVFYIWFSSLKKTAFRFHLNSGAVHLYFHENDEFVKQVVSELSKYIGTGKGMTYHFTANFVNQTITNHIANLQIGDTVININRPGLSEEDKEFLLTTFKENFEKLEKMINTLDDKVMKVELESLKGDLASKKPNGEEVKQKWQSILGKLTKAGLKSVMNAGMEAALEAGLGYIYNNPFI